MEISRASDYICGMLSAILGFRLPVKFAVAVAVLALTVAAGACTKLKAGSTGPTSSAVDSRPEADSDDHHVDALGASAQQAEAHPDLSIDDAALDQNSGNAPDGTTDQWIVDVAPTTDLTVDYPLVDSPVIRDAGTGESVPPSLAIPLHGQVQWTSATHIIVTYDWSSDGQLEDWRTTSEAALTRPGDGTVKVTSSAGLVRAMIWKLPMAATRIRARGKTLENNTLNIYAYLSPGWHGTEWYPNPGLGIVYAYTVCGTWIHPGPKDVAANQETFPGPGVENNVFFDFDVSFSASMLSSWSSVTQDTRVRSGQYDLYTSGIVALGSYEGNNTWGKVIIEGDIAAP